MAVTSAGPYANDLHLAPDRQPHQLLITHFLHAECSSWRPTNCQSTKGIHCIIQSNATIMVLFRWPEVPEIAFGTYWLRHPTWWRGYYPHCRIGVLQSCFELFDYSVYCYDGICHIFVAKHIYLPAVFSPRILLYTLSLILYSSNPIPRDVPINKVGSNNWRSAFFDN